MGIIDIVNASKIKEENQRLLELFNKIGASDAIQVQKRIEELNLEKQKLKTWNEQKTQEIQQLTSELINKRKQILVVDEELALESFALYKPKFKFQASAEYKNRLDDVREKQKAMIKNRTAAEGNQNWTINNSLSQGRKLVNDMIKLVLRSFNNECDYCVDNVKFNNIELSIKRIEQSFETLNKLGKIMEVSINPTYKSYKLDELQIAYEYQQKKQEEKEEQRKAREELREQQKLEQEIKIARDKVLKERKHFTAALLDLRQKLTVAKDENEKQFVEDKINEIQNSLSELEKEEKVIDYREQNAKAGYVYVISNIGAFGGNVYKIGMTRRLEPMDRIDELGDASVPFSFDVHAMIFSENAPELESKLHQHFHESRINKLNNRKEFFKADIYDIERIIKSNYDKVVDVIKEASAEQYRQSLILK